MLKLKVLESSGAYDVEAFTPSTGEKARDTVEVRRTKDSIFGFRVILGLGFRVSQKGTRHIWVCAPKRLVFLQTGLCGGSRNQGLVSGVVITRIILR